MAKKSAYTFNCNKCNTSVIVEFKNLIVPTVTCEHCKNGMMWEHKIEQ